ncbi:MAG: hypothetical protein PHU14_03060 [Methylovulum sp.]|nr:hypothetical protein [Methylovulum sp.]
MTQPLEGNFNPAFHFLGLIQKAVADGITRHCVHPSCPDVYLVPSEHLYYSTARDIQALRSLCLAAPFDLDVKPLPDWHPGPKKEADVQAGRMVIHRKTQTESAELVGRPLPELLWYATLCASEGQLLQGCHADTPVHLMACPDFSRFFHRADDPILAAFMLDANVALTSIAAATGIPLPQIFDFYNACAIIGLIEVDNVFNPANYLPGLLEKAKADRQIRRCSLAGGLPLFIAPAESKYYTELEPAAFGKLCATPLSGLEVTIVEGGSGKEELVQVGRTWVRRKKEAALPKLPGHPLADLQFRAVLYASQGRLLYGYQLDTPVRLNGWPDKALLRESASIMDERYIFPLTAYMTANKAFSLPGIAQATHLPLDRVIDFHNACALAGLLEHPG